MGVRGNILGWDGEVNKALDLWPLPFVEVIYFLGRRLSQCSWALSWAKCYKLATNAMQLVNYQLRNEICLLLTDTRRFGTRTASN
jgi:hypothetical protein